MKENKGFTLIELLAVIIILGILMIIAIPSVTKYISDSRKNAYVDTAKEIIGSARNLVNSGKLGMYDPDITYYISQECIKTENATKSPYGDFIKAYVVVTFNGTGYDYYWTSVDDTGIGISKITSFKKLDIDKIESDLITDDIHDTIGIDNRSKYMIINKEHNCTINDSYTVTSNAYVNIKEVDIDQFDVVWNDDQHTFGSIATLKLDLSSFEGYNYKIQWYYQTSSNGDKNMIDGAFGQEYSVKITISNFRYNWGAIVTILDD